MKKNFFGTMVVVAIAVGAMINVNLNKVSNKGDLALANAEASAQDEQIEPSMYLVDRYQTVRCNYDYQGMAVYGLSHTCGISATSGSCDVTNTFNGCTY